MEVKELFDKIETELNRLIKEEPNATNTIQCYKEALSLINEYWEA